MAVMSVRLMRILTSTGILKALGNNVFAHTPLSLAYLDTPEVEFWDLWWVSSAEILSPNSNKSQRR